MSCSVTNQSVRPGRSKRIDFWRVEQSLRTIAVFASSNLASPRPVQRLPGPTFLPAIGVPDSRLHLHDPCPASQRGALSDGLDCLSAASLLAISHARQARQPGGLADPVLFTQPDKFFIPDFVLLAVLHAPSVYTQYHTSTLHNTAGHFDHAEPTPACFPRSPNSGLIFCVCVRADCTVWYNATHVCREARNSM